MRFVEKKKKPEAKVNENNKGTEDEVNENTKVTRDEGTKTRNKLGKRILPRIT